MENENVIVEQQPSGLDRLVAAFCEASMFLKMGILIPLILYYAVKRQEKPFLFRHIQQALFVQLGIIVVSIVYLIPAFIAIYINRQVDIGIIGSLFMIVVGIASIVYALFIIYLMFCMLCAVIQAARGKDYTYPLYNKYTAWRESRKTN